jgi:hypothetical protein
MSPYRPSIIRMGTLTILMMLLTTRETPAGTHLEIRLTTPVGTYSSKVGAPISAVLIASALDLPVGSMLTGEVKAVRRVGLGIVHETAAIEIEFHHITLPDSTVYPISARVIEVDNARESIDSNGLISAERSTASLSNRAAGYVKMAVGLNLHAQLGLWAVKTLIVDVPEPEIFYPAGTDLTLSLNEAVTISARQTTDMPHPLTDDESLQDLVAALPMRTENKAHHASDLINVMFIGSREQLSAAFLAAGWSATPPSTFRSHLRNIRAVMGNEGNASAPMSTLLLDGEAPGMMWQKGLNDVGKRHHIRIWKRAETWNGQEIWIGAATHDVDHAFLRPGMPVTHRISQHIDRERDKVVHDLEFESFVEIADCMDRPEVSHEMHNATGDRMTTDGKLAVVRLRTRPAAQFVTGFRPVDLPRHGSVMERFARREILRVRNDLIRNNSYWRSYEAIRWAVVAARKHHEQDVQVAKVEPKSMGRISGVVALR